MSQILSREMEADTRQFASDLELMAVLADEVKHWTGELKAVDETLELVWAPDNVTHQSLVPGRYHIIEHRGYPTPPNVLPLTEGFAKGIGAYVDTGFMEPGAWMFDALRRGNQWNSQAAKAREKRDQAAVLASERARAREKQDLANELDERVKNIMNPAVSMSRSERKWTNRAQARRAK